MKNAFICFIVGLSTLSFCSVAFTEELPLKLEKNAEQENNLSPQEPSTEEVQPEKTSENTKKKKPRKKVRKVKHKTEIKKSSPRKKSKRKKKTQEIKEEKPQSDNLESPAQDKQEDAVSEELLDAPKQGE